MGLAKEFKDFAMRGNVVDMAVGIVIGSAFGKIVSSLVANIIMPPVGWISGGVDFADLELVLQNAGKDDAGNATAAVAIQYGTFINTVIDFVIIAFAIFMVVKLMNSMKKKQETAPAAPPKPSNEELLLGEIRDVLKSKG